MFNNYAHFASEFIAIHELSDADRKIYQAREAQYRSQYKWSGELEILWSNCLVHASFNVPGKVAYFASIENLRDNRVTRTSPQMFLQRYLREAPEDVRIAWEVEVMGRLLPVVSFVENDEEDDWYHIYDIGPPSCMKGSELVRQYAHPKNNLALAYHQDDSGDIVCRTVVNKKTKAYVRIFGKGFASCFAVSLRQLGYTHDPVKALYGEVIYVQQTQCAECNADILVGPYLDCEGPCIEWNKNEYGKLEGIIGEGDEVFVYGTDDDGNYRCDG